MSTCYPKPGNGEDEGYLTVVAPSWHEPPRMDDVTSSHRPPTRYTAHQIRAPLLAVLPVPDPAVRHKLAARAHPCRHLPGRRRRLEAGLPPPSPACAPSTPCSGAPWIARTRPPQGHHGGTPRRSRARLGRTRAPARGAAMAAGGMAARVALGRARRRELQRAERVRPREARRAGASEEATEARVSSPRPVLFRPRETSTVHQNGRLRSARDAGARDAVGRIDGLLDRAQGLFQSGRRARVDGPGQACAACFKPRCAHYCANGWAGPHCANLLKLRAAALKFERWAEGVYRHGCPATCENL
ncbi:hypothetical protein EJB05_54488, partial [Eragrostis curvula]